MLSSTLKRWDKIEIPSVAVSTDFFFVKAEEIRGVEFKGMSIETVCRTRVVKEFLSASAKKFFSENCKPKKEGIVNSPWGRKALSPVFCAKKFVMEFRTEKER